MKIILFIINDLLGDLFYAKTSYRGKIATERQYAEVIIRKILDIEPDKQITLGDKFVRDEINKARDSEYLSRIVSIINNYGSDTTHTRNKSEITGLGA